MVSAEPEGNAHSGSTEHARRKFLFRFNYLNVFQIASVRPIDKPECIDRDYSHALWRPSSPLAGQVNAEG
jgi:hypothetical protein